MMTTGSAPLALVGGREVAAEKGGLPEQAERIGGDPGAARLLRQRSGIADVHRAVAKGPEPGKCATPLTPFLELDVRHLPPSGAALPRQHVEPIRLVERQPAQKGRIDEREPHRVDADPEGERNDGGRREPAFFSDEPESEAEIAQHVR